MYNSQTIFRAIICFNLLLATLLFTASEMFAQEDNDIINEEDTGIVWKYDGTGRASLSDVGLTHWSAGGQSSTAINSMINFKFERIGHITEWETRLRTGYGVTRFGDRDNRFRKTDDFIILFSRYGRELNDNFGISSSVDFRTQMRRGYTYDDEGNQLETISKFMAPAYLIASIGVDYEPHENLHLNFSPLSGKTTFILRDEIQTISERYGVEPGHSIKQEYGMSFSLYFNYRLMENIRFENELLLFSEYEDPATIDVNWETMLALRVNDYISVTIGTHLIYDEDIQIDREDGTSGPEVQFKRMLNAGLQYSFFQ